jgi:copper homeostasis protein
MVRENDGFTVSGPGELVALQRALASFAGLAVDGAVLGFARGSALDIETTCAVLSAAPTLRATFHRAFDVAGSPDAAIEALQNVPQIDRILTYGGDGDWAARCQRLARYSARAGARLAILAGGGVDERALQALQVEGSVREAHVGRAAREPQVPSAPVSAERVRRLKKAAVSS